MDPVPLLIVDDLEENLVALEALLRRDGLAVLKARSGFEALEILLKREVALALIDVQMPEMDGFELAELMRGAERTRRVPIIFLTAGHADRQRRFRGYEAGAVDFLEKPIEADVLRSKVEVFFELFRQREELRAAAEENARLLSESRRAEEASRQSEERLRLALQASATGLWTWDLATDAATWSPECYRIHDVPAGGFEGTGAGLFRLVHPEDRDRVEAAVREAIARRGTMACEYRVVRPDGGVAWVANRGRADCDAAGVPVRMLGAITDVTERKHAEVELARLNEALLDADRRKDEFLATLAHELRNPLAPLRSSLHIMRLTRGDDPAASEAREVMGRQIAHMVRLIDDLMDVSRISQGKIELKREPVEIRQVIEHAVEASRWQIEAAHHALRLALPAGPVRVDGDPVRLAQVVGNLLNNAAKYTPEGGAITLSAGVEGGEAVIRVTDNGAGLSAEMLPKVFDLFAQVDGTLDRAQGGLGIGLALVRNLVELHGGTVGAESPGEGLGSTFSVRLPLARPAEGPHAPPGEPEPDREDAGPVARRVLVVDDNADAALTLARLLKLLGHEARVVHDGPGAVDEAAAFRPDLVFLDVGLPGMDGYEVCRRVRANPDLSGTTIVALTGWGSEADKARAREAGFDRHLVKPVEFDEVEAILRGLDGRRSPPAPAPG